MLSIRNLAALALHRVTDAVAFADEAARAYREARERNDLRTLERVMAYPGLRRA